MAVAAEVGIAPHRVRASLTPSQKLDLIRQLQDKDKEIVAFVGDGINDSPALAQVCDTILLLLEAPFHFDGSSSLPSPLPPYLY